ncbi:MAG: hypothetical protein O2812_05390 [Chloroflexi bacterium]|nr:hypothetical protein [Chloroflexota bacterium]
MGVLKIAGTFPMLLDMEGRLSSYREGAGALEDFLDRPSLGINRRRNDVTGVHLS